MGFNVSLITIEGKAPETIFADYIFDIPVELFVALGGFRYDRDLEVDDPEPWEVLERVKQKQKKWWQVFG